MSIPDNLLTKMDQTESKTINLKTLFKSEASHHGCFLTDINNSTINGNNTNKPIVLLSCSHIFHVII